MSHVLVLLETAGNQRYIFATNKLRENVGASELTHTACDTWVNEFVPKKDIILATSGKAYILADSEAAAIKVIRHVTTKALKDAPGLDLSGVYELITDGVHNAIQAAHKHLAARRGTNPGVEARFQRLPVVAECRTSGMPAKTFDTEGPAAEHGPRSVVSLAKRAVAKDGIERMAETARNPDGHDIVRNLEELDNLWGSDWLAVIHADGNGLGYVFQHFWELAGKPDDPTYRVRLKQFSDALDDCTASAFRHALRELFMRLKPEKKKKPLPVVPIVLGGDDMTVVMDGKYAVQFTIDFLKEFEKQTQASKTITDIIPGGVTACAGVAITKPHFPFYAAYELAESLIKSAKAYAKPRGKSAFDFHILYDASGADLERIREELTIGDAMLVARPYVVSETDGNRTTARLAECIAAIQAENAEGRRAIPNAQAHELRSALFLGESAAEARLKLISTRYEKELKHLLTEGKLFWSETDDKGNSISRTHLLDAMDLFDFWAAKEGE